jgi:hypothetical protein
MKTSICFTIVFLIVIIICMIFFIQKKKESFETSEEINFKILDTENDSVITEFINFKGFKFFIDPLNEDEQTKFIELDKNSAFIYNRKENSQNKNFSLGFYYKKYSNIATYNKFIVGTDSTNNETFSISLSSNSIIITYENNNQEIFIDNENILDDEFNYIILKGDINTDSNIPEITILLNNKKTVMKLNNKEGDNLSLKKITFGNNDNANKFGFEGFIGKVLLYNEIIGNSTICKYYNCNINCFEPDGTNYTDSVNGCIKDCMGTCNDIEKCQNICVNCEVEGKFWDMEEKKNKCPWITDIKQEIALPDAPQIRGFPGDSKILVEWKKPFDGGSEITNFIVLYYETFNKKLGVNVSISGKNTTDICEYEIKNLKNRTYYDVVVRATNSKGIGAVSNTITVAPNGNVILNNNRNIFSELEDELQKDVDSSSLDYMCNMNNFDSIGHSLDYYDNDMRDIKSYIENLKK